MKAHEYWFSHYGVRRNPGIFLCLFALQKIILNCIFDFFIFLQLLHYFPVLSISFFANINPSFCICCIIQIFLLFLLLLSMHDKYFFNKLWIIFALNHTHLCHAHIANIQNNPCNHYYTDYQTNKPPFFIFTLL